MKVLTYANRRNQFLDEWEISVKDHGFEYQILGMNEVWENWSTRTNAIIRQLETMKSDELIVFCDAFDLLFINGTPEELLQRYNELAKGKILLGTDPYCLPHNCIPNICGTGVTLNAGFVMGTAGDLLQSYRFIKDYDDDQIGWGVYANSHCDKIFIDRDSEVVIDYYTDYHKILLEETGIRFKNLKTNRITEPFSVHLPAQFFNSDTRSEFIRDYLFPYRKKFHWSVYFENLLRSYKLEWATFIIIVLLLLLFVVFGVSLYYRKYR